MTSYALDTDTTFLNGLFLGDVGNQSVSPELRQLIALNQIRDGARDARALQAIQVTGQKIAVDLQRETNDRLSDVGDSLDEMSSGLNNLGQDLSQSMEHGFGNVVEQVKGLREGFLTGMHENQLVMRSGFESVVKGIYDSDDQLGRKIMLGFGAVASQIHRKHHESLGMMAAGTNYLGGVVESTTNRLVQAQAIATAVQVEAQRMGFGTLTSQMAEHHHETLETIVRAQALATDLQVKELRSGLGSLSSQIEEQHQELQTTLISGFDFLSDALGQTGAEISRSIYNAVGLSTKSLIEANEATTDRLVQAQFESARMISQINGQGFQILASGLDEINHNLRQQRSFDQAGLQAVVERLERMDHSLRHQDELRAEEAFIVGMRYFNHHDIEHAYEQFAKARSHFAGYFPVLLMEGFCARLLGLLDSSKKALRAALSQTAVEPHRGARQRALAALFLGRIEFDEKRYAVAHDWFRTAFHNNPRLRTAFVEGAASQLLDPTRPNRREDCQRIKSSLHAYFERSSYEVWYMLALSLTTLAPDLAREAFRFGVHGDERRGDQTSIVSHLFRLNPRTAQNLISLVAAEFPWLYNNAPS